MLLSFAFGYHPVCFALEMNLLYFTYCSSFLLYLGLVVLMILLLHLFLYFFNLFFWGNKEICTNNKKYVKDDKLSNCARKETKTIYNVCLNSKYGEAGAAKN